MTDHSFLPLDNKRIMVTRPAHQAGHLLALLESAGASTFCQPLIDIVPLETAHYQNEINPDEIKQNAIKLIKALPDTDIVIFISQNAIAHGLELISQNGQLPSSVKLATVGAGSAKLLEELTQRSVDITPAKQFNSEGLLEHPDLQHIQGKRITIFRGIGGRSLLADTLRQRGAKVEYAEVYQRQAPKIDLSELEKKWQQQPADAICITSGEGLQNLIDKLNEASTSSTFRSTICNSQLVIVNERLQKQISDFGFTKKPIITDNVSDKAIVDAIIRTLT